MNLFNYLSGAPNISDLFPALARFDLQGIESKKKKLLSWFNRMFESLIDSRTKDHQAGGENKEKKGSNKDFLQILLDDKSSLSMNQVINNNRVATCATRVKAVWAPRYVNSSMSYVRVNIAATT
ncbi:hypothetical protein QYF36_000384 [Acer negundo]|nr:hypothetical protein QYF36_000384 [Acer negundo]